MYQSVQHQLAHYNLHPVSTLPGQESSTSIQMEGPDLVSFIIGSALNILVTLSAVDAFRRVLRHNQEPFGMPFVMTLLSGLVTAWYSTPYGSGTCRSTCSPLCHCSVVLPSCFVSGKPTILAYQSGKITCIFLNGTQIYSFLFCFK